jgi:hypothetical protein
LKQQFVVGLVDPFIHIIPIPTNQSLLLLLNAACLAERQLLLVNWAEQTSLVKTFLEWIIFHFNEFY